MTPKFSRDVPQHSDSSQMHIGGKELLSQKQWEGNNIYVTREAQVEDLTGKPTWGAMVMTSSSCSTIQVESYNNFIKHWSSSQGQSHHLLWVTPTNSSQSDTLHNNIYKEQGKDPFYSDFVLRSIFTILWPSTLITFACFVPNPFPPRTLQNWWVTESCGIFCPRSILTSISSIAGTWSASSDN